MKGFNKRFNKLGGVAPPGATAPTKVAVPVKAAKPAAPKVDGRSKLIGNLGAFAHPPKAKKKAKKK